MTDEEMLQSVRPQEIYIAIADDMRRGFIKQCRDIGIEIIDKHDLNERVTAYKIKVKTAYQLFQAGAFYEIDKHCYDLKNEGIAKIAMVNYNPKDIN